MAAAAAATLLRRIQLESCVAFGSAEGLFGGRGCILSMGGRGVGEETSIGRSVADGWPMDGPGVGGASELPE